MTKLISVIFALLLASCNTLEANSKTNNSDSLSASSQVSFEEQVTPATTQPQRVIKKNSTTQHPYKKKYNNLWLEISDNLSLHQYTDKNLYWHIDWFKKNPKYLTRVSKRAKKYLKIVLDEVKKHGLPYEIALLPIVESAYYPFAFSHGTASGMWQFIPSTGKLYGLRQDFWIDERRDIFESTRAAIAYLKSLHKFFGGNWYHAIAAYNSGPGRVKKSIEKNKKLGKKTDFWSLKLPKETVGYVPRLLAVAQLIKHADKYGQIIEPVPDKHVVGEVLLTSQLDLSIIADWTNLSIDEIYELNAGLNRWATPNSRYHLVLPIEKINAFREKLKTYPKEKRMKWVRHKVKSGDSLSSLAKKYNTSKVVIKEANTIKNNTIIAGKYLIIPIPSKDRSYYSLSQNSLSASKNIKNRTKITHLVKKGDSLWDISRKYGVSVKQLIKWNKLNSRVLINAGDTLVIWQKKSVDTSALKSTTAIKNNIVRNVTYTVKRGDNLSEIAHKFKVTVAEIAKWNNITLQTPLKIGQKLKLSIEIIK